MKELMNKYIWLIDTLTRYERLSREEINDLWRLSPYSNGDPLPERTFFYYRRGIEESFHIDILCDNYGKYYIDPGQGKRNLAFTNWVLETYATNNAMTESMIPAERVSVEDVPSSREYLSRVLNAISTASKVKFSYAGFSRTRLEENITFHPYFVKRYKQRWYMIGYKEKSKDIRTYALDRVKSLNIQNRHFEMPDITPDDFFAHLIGITDSKGEVKRVKIITSPTRAKYFRALPFHSTQQEEITDSYSIFTYRLKLNYELVHELLSYGSSVKVLEPPELVSMVKAELQQTLNLYNKDDMPR